MKDKKKLLFNEKKYVNWTLGVGEKERIKRIVSLVGKGKKILDLGCGLGQIGKLLIDNGNQVYGIDISPKILKKANNKGLITKCVDIETEPLPFRNKFDIVIAAEIIEHVFDTDTLLIKIRKILKDKGELIITTPNLASLGRRLLLLLGENPLIETRLVEDYPKHYRYFPKKININPKIKELSAGHIRYFVKHSLFRLLDAYNFKIIHFSSDIINLTPNGKIRSELLAKLFPTLGRSLIVKAIKC